MTLYMPIKYVNNIKYILGLVPDKVLKVKEENKVAVKDANSKGIYDSSKKVIATGEETEFEMVVLDL